MHLFPKSVTDQTLSFQGPCPQVKKVLAMHAHQKLLSLNYGILYIYRRKKYSYKTISCYSACDTQPYIYIYLYSRQKLLKSINQSPNTIACYYIQYILKCYYSLPISYNINYSYLTKQAILFTHSYSVHFQMEIQHLHLVQGC